MTRLLPLEEVRPLVALERDDAQVRDAQVHLVTLLVLSTSMRAAC